MENEENILGKEKIGKLIRKFSIPCIISLLVNSLYNIVDQIFIGWGVGYLGNGATNVVFPLTMICLAFSLMFGDGASAYLSLKLGEKKKEEAGKGVANGIAMSVIIALIMCVITLGFLPQLLNVFGCTDNLREYALKYGFIIAIGLPFMMIGTTLNSIIRADGNPKYAMTSMVLGAILNTILDPIFIFVFKMGVGGAGCATMLSQAIGFVILLIGCTKKGNIRISFKNFRFKKQLYKEIFRGGIPSLARQGLASLAMVAMNRLAGGYGDAAIAAMSIVSKIMNFFGAAVIGFGQGFQPVCGFNYGAKKYDRVKKAFWFSVKVTTVFMTVVAVFGFILSPYVIALFRRDDTDVIAIGSFAFRAQCISLPLSGFIVTANMYLQTIGRAKAATLTAMSRQFLFFVPALLLLVHFFGLTGVEISQAAADVAAFLFSMPICLKVLNIMMTEENKIQ